MTILESKKISEKEAETGKSPEKGLPKECQTHSPGVPSRENDRKN